MTQHLSAATTSLWRWILLLVCLIVAVPMTGLAMLCAHVAVALWLGPEAGLLAALATLLLVLVQAWRLSQR